MAAFGDHDLGVVHEPVDGGGGEAFGHDRVEAVGVQVRGNRDGPAFVDGVDDPGETFGAQTALDRLQSAELQLVLDGKPYWQRQKPGITADNDVDPIIPTRRSSPPPTMSPR